MKMDNDDDVDDVDDVDVDVVAVASVDGETQLKDIYSLLQRLQRNLIDLKTDSLLVREKLDNIEAVLSITNEKINTDVVKECQKMGSHIDFVEKVYDNVKHPLNFVCENINYIAGRTVPSIDHDDGDGADGAGNNQPQLEFNTTDGPMI